MRDMHMFGSREQPRRFAALRELISNTKNSEALALIPDRLESIFTHFDRVELATRFRSDIHLLLACSCALAEALADNTYPADVAQQEVSTLLQVLARINSHLSERPALNGYAIFFPQTGTVMSQFFSARSEAEAHLTRLIQLGISEQCYVAPARLISQHVVQPRYRVIEYRFPAPAHTPTHAEAHAEVVVKNAPPAESERIKAEAERVAAASITLPR